MSNELVLLFSALINIFFIFIASRLGLRWLLCTIAVNLILISIFGSKLISVFGLITNAGNVFYACVFLATHFLIEKKEERSLLYIKWFGAGFVIFFIAMSQLTIKFSSLVLDDPISSALNTVFSLSPQIALASIIGYIFAQHVNVSIYEWLKTKTKGKFLWLRSNVANIIAQLVDSTLFFTIAFLDFSGMELVQAIFAGWLIKTLVVLLGTPLLYLDRYLTRPKKTS